MEIVSHWRREAWSYSGAGRGLFRFKFQSGVDEMGGKWQEMELKSGLLQIEMKMRREEGDEVGLRDWGSQVVERLRDRQMDEGPIKKIVLEMGEQMGKEGGEEFVMGALGVEDLPSLVMEMKGVEMERERVGEWLFGVNGFSRESVEDREEVGELLAWAYEER